MFYVHLLAMRFNNLEWNCIQQNYSIYSHLADAFIQSDVQGREQ